MKGSYRLLAVDLDGTLIGPEKGIPSRLQGEVARLQRRGVGFTIATGRLMASVLPYARQLSLSCPVIASSGAVIGCPGTGQVHAQWPLSGDLIQEVLEETKGTGVGRYLAWRDYMATDAADSASIERYAGILGVEIRRTGDLPAQADEEGTDPVLVLLLRGDRERLDSLERLWTRRLTGRASLIRPFPHLLEIISPRASKSQALTWLAGKMRVPLEKVVAIGDGPGDVDMIEVAGLGVAVANAPDSVRKRADWVTSGSYSEGVLEVIRELFGGGEGRV